MKDEAFRVLVNEFTEIFDNPSMSHDQPLHAAGPVDLAQMAFENDPIKTRKRSCNMRCMFANECFHGVLRGSWSEGDSLTE